MIFFFAEPLGHLQQKTVMEKFFFLPFALAMASDDRKEK